MAETLKGAETPPGPPPPGVYYLSGHGSVVAGRTIEVPPDLRVITLAPYDKGLRRSAVMYFTEMNEQNLTALICNPARREEIIAQLAIRDSSPAESLFVIHQETMEDMEIDFLMDYIVTPFGQESFSFADPTGLFFYGEKMMDEDRVEFPTTAPLEFRDKQLNNEAALEEIRHWLQYMNYFRTDTAYGSTYFKFFMARAEVLLKKAEKFRQGGSYPWFRYGEVFTVTLSDLFNPKQVLVRDGMSEATWRCLGLPESLLPKEGVLLLAMCRKVDFPRGSSGEQHEEHVLGMRRQEEGVNDPNLFLDVPLDKTCAQYSCAGIVRDAQANYCKMHFCGSCSEQGICRSCQEDQAVVIPSEKEDCNFCFTIEEILAGYEGVLRESVAKDQGKPPNAVTEKELQESSLVSFQIPGTDCYIPDYTVAAVLAIIQQVPNQMIFGPFRSALEAYVMNPGDGSRREELQRSFIRVIVEKLMPFAYIRRDLFSEYYSRSFFPVLQAFLEDYKNYLGDSEMTPWEAEQTFKGALRADPLLDYIQVEMTKLEQFLRQNAHGSVSDALEHIGRAFVVVLKQKEDYAGD